MVYISIESRKGGVGKTTTALVLAETLLSEGFQVLMVDMDIVGTTIDSAFINAGGNFIHEVKLNGEAVNLVHLFKEVFMAGKNVPSFALESEHKDKAFSYAMNRCNFIGSNIYDSTSGTKPLEDPRILYDAFHAYWLLEFVKGISLSFNDTIGKSKKVAIILDNSPGFSSIENVIHDYLTDLGPEKGKVLLVSTIDTQDIEACRQSKNVIQTLFDDKVAAGKYYRSMRERGEGQKRETQAFESVWNSLCASGGQEPEYHTHDHEVDSPFVSVLVNKVPQIIFEQLFAKGVLHKEFEVATPFQNHLLYFFSDPQLISKEITHLQSYAGRLEEYQQSGNIVEIESDDSRYLDACGFFRQLGLGDFFKNAWAPKACFNDILKVMEGQELLAEESKGQTRFPKGVLIHNGRSLADEVKMVERFVMYNLKKNDQMQRIMPSVVEYVTDILREVDSKTKIDFHPDHPRLQDIGDFVTSFGLAVYRLHIYEQICKIFNRLMDFCLENVEDMEKLNKEAISIWIDNILEGRVIDRDAVVTLEQMLNDRKNARELRKALKVIVRSWELKD